MLKPLTFTAALVLSASTLAVVPVNDSPLGQDSITTQQQANAANTALRNADKGISAGESALDRGDTNAAMASFMGAQQQLAVAQQNGADTSSASNKLNKAITLIGQGLTKQAGAAINKTQRALNNTLFREQQAQLSVMVQAAMMACMKGQQ